MKAFDSPPSIPERTVVPLRVRFYPLWGWFFVGSVLFAQSFLVSRLWGGWNAMALLQLVAFQILFLPRIVLLAGGISLGLTLLSSRLVHWIARPMARRWFEPTSVLPPASEIPLYLRTGERPQLQIAARRKADHVWEPGWLIVTESRIVWLSGIWRTVIWDVDTLESGEPLAAHVRLGHSPRWFGGYVVGAPPRVYVERDDANSMGHPPEVLAMADPYGFADFLRAGAETQADHADEPDPVPQVSENPIRPEVEAAAASSETDTAPAPAKSPERPQLPPRRDYTKKRPKRTRVKADAGKTDKPAAKRFVGKVELPPRRNLG